MAAQPPAPDDDDPVSFVRLDAVDAVPLRRGEVVQLRASGSAHDAPVRAFVGLVSTNGRSLVVLFDGMLGNWAGAAPLFQADDGSWHTLDGQRVTLTRTPPH